MGHPKAPENFGEFVLENEHIRAEIDEVSGELSSLILKSTGFEYMQSGIPGNRFEIYEDANTYPSGLDHRWDPWYIHLTGRKYAPVGVTEVSWKNRGRIRQTILVRRRLDLAYRTGATQIFQEIILDSRSPYLLFHTYGEWNAEQVLVKLEFDLSFQASEHTCEMPYGISRRSNDGTGNNGNHERMEPDLPMQRWLDYSDGHAGLAFLNNGKYGYDVQGSLVRLSLMRAPPMRPGEIAGLGAFDFSYALYPHTGDWSDADVVKNASLLNRSPEVYVVGNPSSPSNQFTTPVEPLIQVEDSRVSATALKVSEDDTGVILRLWCCAETTVDTTVAYSFPVAKVYLCNALEETSEELDLVGVSSNEVALAFFPEEFKTLLAVLDRSKLPTLGVV